MSNPGETLISRSLSGDPNSPYTWWVHGPIPPPPPPLPFANHPREICFISRPHNVGSTNLGGNARCFSYFLWFRICQTTRNPDSLREDARASVVFTAVLEKPFADDKIRRAWTLPLHACICIAIADRTLMERCEVFQKNGTLYSIVPTLNKADKEFLLRINHHHHLLTLLLQSLAGHFGTARRPVLTRSRNRSSPMNLGSRNN